jgi:DNA-binding NarL/FixJ family response regulator
LTPKPQPGGWLISIVHCQLSIYLLLVSPYLLPVDSPIHSQARSDDEECMDSDSTFDIEQDFRQRFEWLTTREREVMALLVDGMTNKAAADALGLSRRTVETHRSNILQKLRARSNEQLRELFVRYGIASQS